MDHGLTACLFQRRSEAGLAGLLEPGLVLRQLRLVQVQHDALHQCHDGDALGHKITQGLTCISRHIKQ